MQTSATGSSAPRADRSAAAAPFAARDAGFTLIELMVVIAILALASATVLFAFPDPRGSLRSEAERFAARVRAAQDMAVMQARPIALVAAADGYRFEMRGRGRWTSIVDKPLDPVRWGAGTRARIAAAQGGRAVFDPTGLGDPLDLTLVRDGAQVAVHVGQGGTVDVRG